MRRITVAAALSAVLVAAALALAGPAMAQDPVPFQTFALNRVSVPAPGAVGTFQCFVQHPTATQARGSYEWYISATVTVNAIQQTNMSWADHVLTVGR